MSVIIVHRHCMLQSFLVSCPFRVGSLEVIKTMRRDMRVFSPESTVIRKLKDEGAK